MKKTKFILLILSIIMLAASVVMVGCGTSTYKVVYEQLSGATVELEVEVGKAPATDKIPTLESKVGYTGEWATTDFSTAKKGETVTVKPEYTAKQFTVTIEGVDGADQDESFTVTYDSAYSFSSITPANADLVWADAYLNGTTQVAKTGTWNIDSTSANITLTPYWKAKITFVQLGKENVEKIVELGTTLTEADFPELTTMPGLTFAWETGAMEKVTNIQKNATVTSSANVEIVEKTKVAYSEDMFATGEKKLTGVDVSDGTYSLTINGRSLSEVTVTDGVINLGTETFFANAGCTLGNTYNVVLSNATASYVQPFKYVSDTISSVDEFSAMTHYYSSTGAMNTGTGFYDGTTEGTATDEDFVPRYYILTANIETLTWEYDVTDCAFFDTLDGNGFLVHLSGSTKTGSYGIFGLIYGTVKNTSFKFGQFGVPSENSNSLAKEIYSGAVIENVYLNHSNSHLKNTNKTVVFNGIGYNLHTGATIKDVYINVGDDITNSNIKYGGYIARNFDERTANSGTSATLTNIRVVSASLTLASHHNNLSSIIVAKNDDALITTFTNAKVTTSDIYRYDTAQAMIDAGVSKVGNWVVATDGTATWEKA